jgi:hypothetical protein
MSSLQRVGRNNTITVNPYIYIPGILSSNPVIVGIIVIEGLDGR